MSTIVAETEIVEVFRSMDDRHQHDLIRFLKVVTQRHPTAIAEAEFGVGIDVTVTAGGEQWWPAAFGSLPAGEETVIVWDAENDRPDVAYFDSEEQCWLSQREGVQFNAGAGAVTNWRRYQAPTSDGGEGSK